MAALKAQTKESLMAATTDRKLAAKRAKQMVEEMVEP
jgi:hypothetical protein